MDNQLKVFIMAVGSDAPSGPPLSVSMNVYYLFLIRFFYYMHIYFVLDCNYMPLIVTACVLPNADVYYVLEIKE